MLFLYSADSDMVSGRDMFAIIGFFFVAWLLFKAFKKA